MFWFFVFFISTLFFGMTPMDVSATLLGFAAIYSMWSRRVEGRRWPFFLTGFDWIFPIWILVIFLGYATQGIWDNSFGLKLIEFKWLLFLYLLIFAISRSRIRENVIPGITLLAVLAGGYAISISVMSYDPIKDLVLEPAVPGGVLARTGGLFSHPMTLAHCYSLILCWFFGSLIVSGRFRDRMTWWLLAGTSVLSVAVLLTFTRGVWGSVAIAFLVMTFVYSVRWGIGFSLVGLGVFASLFSFWPLFHDRLMQSFSGTSYDSERIYLWKANWMIFKEHPIFGVGYGHNTSLLPEYFEKLGVPAGTLISHAHNQYLHLLAGTGVLGLTGYLLVLLMFLLLSIRTWREIPHKHVFQKGLCLGLIGAQVANIFGGLFEANFEHAKYRYVLVTTWAFVVWLAYEYRILRERI